MEFGITSFLTDYGIGAPALAHAVEERGFAALFLTEHTHIPASRRTPWPGGGDLPRAYSHTLDPYVALGAMATVTDHIVLGTAVTLINQHHPITLAKQVASVERLAPGRIEIGVGPGWNVEEMAHHGIDPRRRTAQMLERIEALHAIWTQEEAEYHGEFVDFAPIWSWPKPSIVPPVLIGGGGPTVLDRVLSHGDGWMPLRIGLAQFDAFADRVADLRERAAAAGRGHVPVTIFGGVPEPEWIDGYEGAGADRVLFTLADQVSAGAAAATLDELDALATATAHARRSSFPA